MTGDQMRTRIISHIDTQLKDRDILLNMYARDLAQASIQKDRVRVEDSVKSYAQTAARVDELEKLRTVVCFLTGDK